MRPPSHRAARPALLLGLVLGAGLALSGCEQGKPRHPPPDPMATGPGPVEEQPIPPALSDGLPKRPQMAGFFLDHAGAALDPFNKPPAVTPRDRPLVFDGFGFDPVGKVPAKGVDVEIDGKLYGTTYSLPRQDVADYFHAPALAHTGFRTVLPSTSLAVGPHSLTLRVVAPDGSSYYESPRLAFQVQ